MDEELPEIVARVMREEQQAGASYEEANWPRLSPAFRAAHNRLRQARHLLPIPDPVVDLYVPPRGPAPQPFDAAEAKAIDRAFEAGEIRLGGGGFEDRGATPNPHVIE